MKTFANPADVAEIQRRLTLVRPDSVLRWGRMSAHQMVCHLTDAFLVAMDQKHASAVRGWHNRTLIKWIALYVPLRWPAGIETVPEIDQSIGGTKPDDFRMDVGALEAAMERFLSAAESLPTHRHPIFGAMSTAAWMRWGYLHMDHHLRQFGV